METVLILLAIASLLMWKLVGLAERWYRQEIRLLEKFETHADEFFKHADQVLDDPDTPVRWAHLMARLSFLVTDKEASNQFSSDFQSDQFSTPPHSTQSESGLDSLPAALRDMILAATYHAVLAISYNSGFRGYLLRAQFADMFEKPSDKIKSTQIVMNGVNSRFNRNDMVPA